MAQRLSPTAIVRQEWARAATLLAVLLILALFSQPVAARWIDLGGDPVTVTLLESDASRSVVEITVGGFEAEPVLIQGEIYHHIYLQEESLQRVLGLPELPSVRRALIVPDDQEMAVRVIVAEQVELEDLPVAPSKGHLLRTVDPAMVAYTFADFYASDDVYPTQVATADEPHIMRDFRGLVVQANPFQYLPATQTLRVYTRLVIEVAPVGPGQINVLERSAPPVSLDRQFTQMYENHFLNFGSGQRYDTVLEDGGLLVIAYDDFMSYIQPLIDWKIQKGVPTRLVALSEVGPTSAAIYDYIAAEYASWNLAYVLLVGDAQQVPRWTPDSDPGYSLLAGSDSYPEIFVGRFSAENAEHVITQVQRTIAYERDVAAGPDWAQRGTGIASNQGPGHYGEYDDDHMDFIREDLLGYGYLEVDRIYDPSATDAMVAAALNAGRGIVNYCGHGSTTSWGSSGFNTSDVNALVNDGMLPFIHSVACNNGTFYPGTCFAEAWQRATHNEQPSGAIGCYMSYVSQSWDPPMYAQDETIDLLVADAMRTLGGLWFNGSCHMMDMTGTTGQYEFRNWTLFGDPSVMVRTKVASEMTVAHTGVLLVGLNEYPVTVVGQEGALCALYADGVLYGSALTDATGQAVIALADPPLVPMDLTLTVTAYNRVTQVTEVHVLPPEGPYLVFDGVNILNETSEADGVLDNGETAELQISLGNVGVEDATGISATLTTGDAFLTIPAGGLTFPDIPAGGQDVCHEACPVMVTGDVPDGHLVQFELNVTADNGSWTTSFVLPLQAPVLEAGEVTVDDTAQGDADWFADAGETVDITLSVTNVGHAGSGPISSILSSMDGNVIILGSSARSETVPEGGSVVLGPFQVQVLPSCPEPSYLNFVLAVEDDFGYEVNLDFEIMVGGWYDNAERNRGWTITAPGDDATSGIWVRVDPVGTSYNGDIVQPEDDHTDDGSFCFVTGNGSVGGTAGENDVDGGSTTLLSPVFELQGAISATVSYWRWYTNTSGNNPDQDWWDVEVTSDGTNWISLEHTQESLAAWTQFTFDLADYIPLTDNVQLRFIARDDYPGSLVEAAVDDFLLQVVWSVIAGADDEQDHLPVRLSLAENYPNPFNPKTTINFDLPRPSRVELAVYDLSGRRVATLVSDELDAGRHAITWLGRDDADRQVASGVYFYRLQAGDEVMNRKMMLVK
jgi:hypothetical protein